MKARPHHAGPFVSPVCSLLQVSRFCGPRDYERIHPSVDSEEVQPVC